MVGDIKGGGFIQGVKTIAEHENVNLQEAFTMIVKDFVITAHEMNLCFESAVRKAQDSFEEDLKNSHNQEQ